jgi:high mobility group protein B3
MAPKERKPRKKKDPNAPKKPKTSYFLFCDEKR